MRIIFVALFLFFFLILSIPILGIEWVIGKFSKNTKDYSSLRLVQWAFKVIIKISGVELTVLGEENIPDEAVLFVGNHRSYFDIVLTYARCKRLCGFVAKKEMLRYPVLRKWMQYLYCLFLDRDDIRAGLKTILTAIDYVKSGISISIYPEGTRGTGDELEMLPFKDGALKIAQKTGCAIIPVSINNSSAIFEDQAPWIKKTHVVIEYGTPIYPNELDKETKKHLGTYCQNIILETLKKNQSLV